MQFYSAEVLFFLFYPHFLLVTKLYRDLRGALSCYLLKHLSVTLVSV